MAPLARLVNVYLSSLNDLRRFLLVGSRIPLRTFLHGDYVPKIIQVLKQNERIVMTPGFLQGKGDAAKNLRSCASGMQDMVQSCVQVYMMNALEVALGVLNETTKTEPVLPEKEEEDENQVNQEEEVAEANMMEMQEDDAMDAIDKEKMELINEPLNSLDEEK